MAAPRISPAAVGGLARVLIGGGLAVYGAASSLFNVEGGHRAIVFNRLVGIKDEVYSEGTHLMVPWFERPVIFDVRARPSLIQSQSGSRDLQMVRDREGSGGQLVSKDIRRILAERARYFNIVLEDVSITQLTFSKEYTAAVEAKQVAQQEAERAKFI
eukprot:gene14791-14969_t